MPDVRPFRAWRYDLGRVGALSDVVAPPYDVIDPGLQRRLYDRHPNNVIRLILNREEPGDDERHNRYTRAARFLKDWQFEGALRQDTQPGVYVYHQSFEIDGRRHTRRGVLARVRLEKLGEGKIYAHEETMPGPKADRLQLVRAIAMNLSPIFGLYPDPENAIQGRLDAAVGRSPPREAVDHLGTVNRYWPLTQTELIGELQRLFFAKPVFIADGHHRYETSLEYARTIRAAQGLPTGETYADSHADFVLMMLVGMSDPGLLILPTHRLVSGLPALTAGQLRKILKDQFELEPVGQGEAGAAAAWERIEVEDEQSLLAFGTVADGEWQLVRLRSDAALDSLAAGHSPAWRSLGVSILHVLVLNHLVGNALGTAGSCGYVHQLGEVVDWMNSASGQLAVLVPAAHMHHVEQIAGSLEKMPAKSTYFYPKLLSGLVFNSLK